MPPLAPGMGMKGPPPFGELLEFKNNLQPGFVNYSVYLIKVNMLLSQVPGFLTRGFLLRGVLFLIIQ